jgi:hypothetical protein
MTNSLSLFSADLVAEKGWEKAKIIQEKIAILVSSVTHFFNCELLRFLIRTLFRNSTLEKSNFLKRLN